MSAPLFLPWLRRGLAAEVGATDSRRGPLDGSTELTASITVLADDGDQHVAERPVHLFGPGAVVQLEPGQVVQRWPSPGSVEAEAGFFPYVELAAADLPWRLTPAQPDAEQALRPWLVLVCVREQPAIRLDDAAQPLPVLHVPAELVADELPDLDESWAWAHVQALVPAAELATLGEAWMADPGLAVARLLCPRRLEPGTTYRCALVPAFVADPDGRLTPAWDTAQSGGSDLALAVYETWTFTTSPAPGSFETLARRLEPALADDVARIGYHPAVIDGEPSAEDEATFDYAGALVSPGSTGAGLPPQARDAWRTALRTLLEDRRLSVPRQEPADYDPGRDDPVVGPPVYGSIHAGVDGLPPTRDPAAAPKGWLEQVNLRVDHRAAAGVGARLIREHAEELLQAAWNAAAAGATAEETNRTQLAAAVGRSHARRLATLDDGSLLQVSVGMHPAVLGNAPVAESAMAPTGLVSPAFARAARAGGVIGRRARQAGQEPGATSVLGNAEEMPLAAASVDPFVAASSSAPAAGGEPRVAEFRTGFVPTGCVTTETRYVISSSPRIPTLPGRLLRAQRRPGFDRFDPRLPEDPRFRFDKPLVGDPVPGEDLVVVQPRSTVVPSEADDLSGLAEQLRSALVPDIPAPLAARPLFDAPLLDWLVRGSPELASPGLDDLTNNRVVMLEVNEAWVAAFLVAANHEWSREAVFHEFPTDPRSTAFTTLFPGMAVPEIRDWAAADALGATVGGEGTSTVLVVRGDVVRAFPGTEFLLVERAADGAVLEPDGTMPDERVTWPIFVVGLDRETMLVGFDVDPDVVLGQDRLLGLQEPMTGPRFGLDDASRGDYGTAPNRWSNLSWGHVVGGRRDLDTLSHAPVAAPGWLDGLELPGFAGQGRMTWGRNSAHQAGITTQQPFRLLVPARLLLPPAVAPTERPR